VYHSLTRLLLGRLPSTLLHILSSWEMKKKLLLEVYDSKFL
jgi:hypothetical protein